jgi:hypothetical protein
LRTMYDSVNPFNIPTTAEMVAGYVDGRYAWSDAGWARFPYSVKVRIAVFPTTNDGHVLDVENGDATPQQAPGWVRMRRLAGFNPSVYCSESIWSVVRAAFQASGVTEPQYWVAAYPGEGTFVPPGAVAHQYNDVGLYDLSVVNDYWPGVDWSDGMGTWFKYTTATGAVNTGYLLESGMFYGLPMPASAQYVDLNVNGQSDADAYWADLTSHYAKAQTRGPVNG